MDRAAERTNDRLLDSDLAICDAVSMEVLAGARDERHLIQLRGLLARATMVPLHWHGTPI